MLFVEPEQDQMQTFLKSDIEGPIHMLNLIRLKKDGGLESYAKYGEATGPCLAKVGGKIVYQAQGRFTVIGGETWDMVFIVEYPSRDKFIEMVTSEEYQKGAHLRGEGVEDSRLVCMQSGSVM